MALWALDAETQVESAWRMDLIELYKRRFSDENVFRIDLDDGSMECMHQGTFLTYQAMAQARLHGALRSWLGLSTHKYPWSRFRTRRYSSDLVRDLVYWMYTDHLHNSLSIRLEKKIKLPEAQIRHCMFALQNDMLSLSENQHCDLCLVRTCGQLPYLLGADAQCIVTSVTHAATFSAEVSTSALIEASTALDMLGVKAASAYVLSRAWIQALARRECVDILLEAGPCPVPISPSSILTRLLASPEPVLDPIAHEFLLQFPEIIATDEWRQLIATQDQAAAPMLEILNSNLTPMNAASRYRMLVGDVVLAEDGPRPEGDLYEKIELIRCKLIRYLQHHWVAVRADHGFDSIPNWCVKELSYALDVDVHALRMAPLTLTTDAGAPNSSVFALTSAGFGDRGRELDPCASADVDLSLTRNEKQRGPVSLLAAAINKAAARTAAATGRIYNELC
ncbi:hypothetical protein MYAM1_003333 [Malassezia yamatoensis]|uniref:Uncharacterized protein n=1 Tax=Malassezia yamatoensis TaxID=253288 RepID=A0AAJ5YXK8_9BASI|nr:hypothetical protein MYAM1_003333 [Malassezia yamatoensis]